MVLHIVPLIAVVASHLRIASRFRQAPFAIGYNHDNICSTMIIRSCDYFDLKYKMSITVYIKVVKGRKLSSV